MLGVRMTPGVTADGNRNDRTPSPRTCSNLHPNLNYQLPAGSVLP
jgi:hypothetical protein